jgi:hypothetical protein
MEGIREKPHSREAALRLEKASSLYHPERQDDLATTLVEGGTIQCPLLSPEEVPHLRLAAIAHGAGASLAAYQSKPVLILLPSAQQALEKEIPLTAQQRINIGMEMGAVTGAGAGLFMALIRHADPTSGVLFTIAGALAGSGLLGVLASGVIPKVGVDPSGKFEITGYPKATA